MANNSIPSIPRLFSNTTVETHARQWQGKLGKADTVKPLQKEKPKAPNKGIKPTK